jgi:hypothetical protein
MVMTTSAARTVSSVHGLGNSLEMSMPRSAMAAIAAGLTSCPGSDPPDQATARSRVRASKNPRPSETGRALCVHKDSTVGLLSRCSLFDFWTTRSRCRDESLGHQWRNLLTAACYASWS